VLVGFTIDTSGATPHALPPEKTSDLDKSRFSLVAGPGSACNSGTCQSPTRSSAASRLRQQRNVWSRPLFDAGIRRNRRLGDIGSVLAKHRMGIRSDRLQRSLALVIIEPLGPKWSYRRGRGDQPDRLAPKSRCAQADLRASVLHPPPQALPAERNRTLLRRRFETL